MQLRVPRWNLTGAGSILTGEMSALRTTAAAALLDVSPSTLRAWEARFGFPAPRRTEGGHRLFDREDVEALRDALAETGDDLARAMALAQDRGRGPTTATGMLGAMLRFDAPACDRLLEESLALRSVERTVSEVVLPAVDGVVAQAGQESAEHGFAFRWATGWLAAATRVAPPATRDTGVLVFDAGAPPDVGVLAVQGLELVLRRLGVPVLTLTAGTHPDRLARAVRAVRPSAVVLSGTRIALHDVGKLVHAVRRADGADAVLVDFRGPIPDTGASTVVRLPAGPVAACAVLLDAVARARGPVAHAVG